MSSGIMGSEDVRAAVERALPAHLSKTLSDRLSAGEKAEKALEAARGELRRKDEDLERLRGQVISAGVLAERERAVSDREQGIAVREQVIGLREKHAAERVDDIKSLAMTVFGSRHKYTERTDRSFPMFQESSGWVGQQNETKRREVTEEQG